jgi:hypothetical protein
MSYKIIADGIVQAITPKQSYAIQLAKRLAKRASTVTLEASNGWIIKKWSKS